MEEILLGSQETVDQTQERREHIKVTLFQSPCFTKLRPYSQEIREHIKEHYFNRLA